jgi:hypothetical protein
VLFVYAQRPTLVDSPRANAPLPDLPLAEHSALRPKRIEIIERLIRTEHMEAAISLIDRFSQGAERDEAIATITYALLRAQRVDEAAVLAQQINAPALRAKVRARVADALVTLGRRNDATVVVSRALMETEFLIHPWRSSWIVAHMSMAFAKADDLDHAAAVANTITAPSAKISALVAIVVAYARMGRGTLAAAVAREALDLALRLNEPDRAKLCGVMRWLGGGMSGLDSSGASSSR